MRLTSLIFLLAFPVAVSAQDSLSWKHLSSAKGDLPVPGESTQQTAALRADIDGDGVLDLVFGFRQKAPALVAYRRYRYQWKRYVIEDNYLSIEAGGAAWDIDGDGDLDLVFGGDYQSNAVWWWENPYPNWDARKPWTRHVIKQSGATQHHDQLFGDFLQTGHPQLVFWNQGGHALFLAEVPQDPRNHVGEWTRTLIFGEAQANPRSWYPEGLARGDIDGDGHDDIVAGNYWLKYLGAGRFRAVRFAPQGGRVAVGKFTRGKSLQVVISSGDGTGPLCWYDYRGDPADSSAWKAHKLTDRDLVHAHSLQVADIDGDGHADIFAAEMAKWTESRRDPDNPRAEAFIFFGDGKGHFRKTVFSRGIGFHEAQVADLNGDGLPDILDKPYNWETPRIDVWLQQQP